LRPALDVSRMAYEGVKNHELGDREVYDLVAVCELVAS
jgi:hypothetical protein